MSSDIKYIHTEEIHNLKAAEFFIPYLFKIKTPESVVDIGCGLGTWLKVLKLRGCSDILGVDGSNVDETQLAIASKEFLVHDLTIPLTLKRKYDLALCLEVAEHLPEDKSDTIIDTLTSCSDNILFSSALPLQGGQNHINEQPFWYWVQKFNKRGFILEDVFRNVIWNSNEIEWWYKQNMFFARRSIEVQKPILDFYHPQRYIEVATAYNASFKVIQELRMKEQDLKSGKVSIKKALRVLFKAFLNKVHGR